MWALCLLSRFLPAPAISKGQEVRAGCSPQISVYVRVRVRAWQRFSGRESVRVSGFQTESQREGICTEI